MLLTGSDIQHNPLRDFVTPRNPRSPHGFLSYLKAKDRLFEFLNLDAPFPPRIEYAGYVTWVAEHFSNLVQTGRRVDVIELVVHPRHGRLIRVCCADQSFLARTVSFAPGRSPLIPGEFAPHLGERVVHLNDYLPAVHRWKARGEVNRIAVVGGSQSAAEIILDLVNRMPDAKILSICRHFGFKLKDVSPFTERIYMPEFVDYFYEASEVEQASITREQWRSNYGAADYDVIAALHLKVYEQKVEERENVRILFNIVVNSLTPCAGGGFGLDLEDRFNGQDHSQHVDALILATGFRNFGGGVEQESCHPLLKKLVRHLRFRRDGGVAVNRDFRLVAKPGSAPLPPIFLNGVCESTHGFGDAGSFSLLAVRSSLIAAAIADACREARSGSRLRAPDAAGARLASTEPA